MSSFEPTFTTVFCWSRFIAFGLRLVAIIVGACSREWVMHWNLSWKEHFWAFSSSVISITSSMIIWSTHSKGKPCQVTNPVTVLSFNYKDNCPDPIFICRIPFKNAEILFEQTCQWEIWRKNLIFYPNISRVILVYFQGSSAICVLRPTDWFEYLNTISAFMNEFQASL